LSALAAAVTNNRVNVASQLHYLGNGTFQVDFADPAVGSKVTVSLFNGDRLNVSQTDANVDDPQCYLLPDEADVDSHYGEDPQSVADLLRSRYTTNKATDTYFSQGAGGYAEDEFWGIVYERAMLQGVGFLAGPRSRQAESYVDQITDTTKHDWWLNVYTTAINDLLNQKPAGLPPGGTDPGRASASALQMLIGSPGKYMPNDPTLDAVTLQNLLKGNAVTFLTKQQVFNTNLLPHHWVMIRSVEWKNNDWQVNVYNSMRGGVDETYTWSEVSANLGCVAYCPLQSSSFSAGVLTINGDQLADPNDRITLSLEAGGTGARVEATLNGTPFVYNQVTKVVVLGNGGDDTLTVTNNGGLALLTGGLTFDGGAGTNTLALKGMTSASPGVIATISCPNVSTFYQLTSGGVLHTGAAGGTWTTLDVNVRSFELLPGGGVADLEANGQLWRYRNGSWGAGPIDVGVQAIALDGDGVLYDLETNGQLWRYRNGSWGAGPIDVGVKTIAVTGDGVLYDLEMNGQLWQFQHGFWGTQPIQTGVTAISVSPSGVLQTQS
jgi:hypothetical protein